MPIINLHDENGGMNQASTIVTILQYNTHLFDGIESYKKLATYLSSETLYYKDEIRRNALAKKILGCGAEIVFLEEVWSDAYKNYLIGVLKAKFPYHFYSPDNNPVGLGSGLLLVSKYEIINPQFQRFTALAGNDAHSQKGLIRAEIRVRNANGACPLYVLFTHTQAQADDKSILARADNLNQIIGELTGMRLEAQSSGNLSAPQLVVGDLNVVAEDMQGNPTDEYRNITRDFPDDFNDLCKVLYPDRRNAPLYTSNPSKNGLIGIFDPKDETPVRLDYAFISNILHTSCKLEVPTDWKYHDAEKSIHMDISDHYPLLFSIPLGAAYK